MYICRALCLFYFKTFQTNCYENTFYYLHKTLIFMNKRIIMYSLPIVLVLFLAFNIYRIANNPRKQILLQVINHVLSLGHFEELDLDEQFSERIYKLYLDKLDYAKRFLLKEDIDKLKQYRGKLSDEIRNTKYTFFELSTDIIKQRIKETELIYEKVLSEPFNFNKKEKFETDFEKLNFPKNEKERYNRWRKLIKYQALQRYNLKLDIQESAIKSNDTSFVIKSKKDMEAEVRKELTNDYKEMYRRYNQLNDKDWLSMYLNSFAGSYDPHTDYMQPKTKENFDIMMSGKLEGIGATLSSQKGYVKVVKIVPGSPSWKQGELKEEDIILKVAQGKNPPVSIVDMRLDDAVKLIRGKKGTEVRLTVKKPDNTITIIPIIRDVIVLEETYAKSAIIQPKGSNKRYGYIDLPSFYVDFKHIRKGRHCSDDIAIEIEKLKREDVDGIIMDLRNNGGGSLKDVVKISGLFIKDGPIVQVKARKGDAQILKDRDRRIQYDGKLVILVNMFSASASEILSAAMQDYKRAVIVGEMKTHGKGTVQNLIDLDRMINTSLPDIKPLGTLRLTIQKFFRINGGSTQLRGVVPDVILPSINSAYDIGEKYLPHALPWTKIEAAPYQKWSLPVINMEEIKAKSRKRIDTSKVFQTIIRNTNRIKDEKKNTIVSLNLKNFRDKQKHLSEESKKYKEIVSAKTSLSSFMLKEDKHNFETLIQKEISENEPVDSSKLISRKRWISNLTKDPYIEEAVYVMGDMK